MVIVEKMPLKDGLIGFGARSEQGSEILFGFMDEEEKIIIEPIYQCVWSFIKGLAKVRLGNKWGYINRANKPVIPIIYDSTENQPDDELLKVCLNGSWGFVDWDNNIIIDLEYDWISNFNNGLAVVKINELYGAIDQFNNVKIPITFEHLNPFASQHSMAVFNGKRVYVSIEGNIIE